MHVVYCDPALNDFAGHFGSHCAALSQGFAEAGAEVTVLGGHHLSNTAREQLHALPAFSVSPYGITSQDPLCGWIKSYLDVASQLCGDLHRIQGITERHLIYFDAATPAALRGLFLWLDSMGAHAPCAIVNLIEQTGVLPHTLADGRNELRAINHYPALYRLTSLMASSVVRARVRYVSIEPEYARVYSHLLDTTVDLVPHPFRGTCRRPSRPPRESITVGFIGAQRAIKGFELVPAITQLLLRSIPHVHVVVHDSRCELRQPLAELETIARDTDRLRLITGELDPDGYRTLLESCDMLVAPYSQPHYSVASSGIAVECLANAIPLVATGATTLARDLTQHGLQMLCVDAFLPEAFVAVIDRAIASWPTIVQRTLEASEKWSQANGPLHAAKAILRIQSDML